MFSSNFRTITHGTTNAKDAPMKMKKKAAIIHICTGCKNTLNKEHSLYVHVNYHIKPIRIVIYYR